jgi:ring-1,2-phenylacetyl-CoA epoxidase subunit PaaD
MENEKQHINSSNEKSDILNREKEVWKILDDVFDPEIPVLSVTDLGIVRKVEFKDESDKEEQLTVTITPTYSGCPAMDAISMNIRFALLQKGFKNIQLKQQISPAWTTDWMSDSGKEKLQKYGIAPPEGKVIDQQYVENLKVECPRCHSKHTELISQFGSTSCKALFKCLDCGEPFDYFKCH